MRANPLRALHRAGQPILNAWLSIPSAYAAELAGHQGFDAATIDLQHGMMGFSEALAMLQAISATPATPLVRPPANEPHAIMRLLDAGAYGVICPMISTRAEAEALVAACRYPPRGRRSFGPARGLLYGGADYFAHADEEILVLGMIETREALGNLDAILDTPGLDGIYVGPNDLAIEIGRKPKAEHDDPEVARTIGHIREAATSRGLIAGIFCSDGPAARTRLAEGFGLVTPGNDAMLLKAGLLAASQEARSATRLR
ncbi:aldolase/citrate lyase family protein (plasmid) [Roseomonas sp. OT10]|uniref:HpcH/HpaI aldolase family protein n=1 Tax=Roseomonas cutis TaxID=2897332 RepID=UPI001E49B4E8|nr:aldolase/citrate lyase family protein [Roseomonas sp. OT10]UFN51645.1 aldolase/citrate lyase family protein [Roseomonas sp. OT10]